MALEIEEAIVTELGAISGLSGKIFPSEAQQGTKAPYLVYELSSSDRLENLDAGHNGHVEANFQLDFYHTSFTDLNALKKLIIAEIKAWNFTNLGVAGPYIQQATIMDYSYQYNDTVKLFTGTIELRINYQE